MKTIIVWFRNDLRVHDLPMLQAAVQNGDCVLPVFILDETLLKGKRLSANRTRFLLESLQDLQASLSRRGGALFIRQGQPTAELLKLARQTGAETVYCTADFTPYAQRRDRLVIQALAKEGIEVNSFPGRLIVDDVTNITTTNGQPIKVFTPFLRHWVHLGRRAVLPAPKHINVPANLDTGTLPALETIVSPDELSSSVAKGGETPARQRLQAFLRQGLTDYHLDHNDLGANATSRLSPHVHFGCISVREIESLLPAGHGPAEFRRQLAWRDFYHAILLHFPQNLKHEFQERYRALHWGDDQTLLKAWQEGRTGYPIVDAAMRQLRQEGWMHNRARLIVGSFLTKDLGLDWRHGETHFLRWLCDGDLANNNGNWQWIASVGVDPAPVFRRLYNPSSQAKTYDPEGVYIRRYVPELAQVSDKFLVEPWKMSPSEQRKAGCLVGRDYPEPIVDHALARKAALERYRIADSPA